MDDSKRRAASFVANCGNKLRRQSFEELTAGLPNVLVRREEDEERVPILPPESLMTYSFTFSRVRLRDGRVRVLIRGVRKLGNALWGLIEREHEVLDSFDMLPNGEVVEISARDEDYCSRA